MFLGSTAPVPSGARTLSGLGTRSHEDNAVAVRAAASPDPLAPTHANGSEDHPTGGEGHPACGGGRVDGTKSGLASAGSGPATAVMPGEGTHEDEGGRVAMASHASLSVLLRVLNMPETADVLTMVRLVIFVSGLLELMQPQEDTHCDRIHHTGCDAVVKAIDLGQG